MYLLPNMGSLILGFLDLPIIEEKHVLEKMGERNRWT